MSKHVDTDLDMAVLETLDFKPVCDSRWHEIFRWPEEAATHVATVPMMRHTWQITWRCQRCADEMYARGWAQ